LWLGIFKRYLAVFLVGNIIKWLDDEVDGNSSVYKFLKGGKYAYSLLILAIALLLDTPYTFSLFTSAYMIGMFHIPMQRLPFGLKSYHEIIVVGIINILLVPIEIFALSLILIFSIQLIDDIFDQRHDSKMGFHNYVNQFGKGEVIIFSLLLILSALMISWIDTLIILPVAIFINYLYCHL